MKSNHLKAFIRYSNKRIVAGSLILAPSMPKTGVWKEVPVDECCSPPANNCDCLSGNNTVVTFTDGEFSYPTTEIAVFLYCGVGGLGGLSSFLGRNILGEVNNTDELLIFLNANFSAFGVFTIVDGNITLTICTAIFDVMLCNEPLRMTIETGGGPQ